MKTSGKRWLLWLPLLAIAGWLGLRGNSDSSGNGIAEPTRKAAAPTGTHGASRKKQTDDAALLRVVPRSTLIPTRLRAKPPRDLFASRSWAPPAPATPPPAVPDTPPPAPFVYVGKKLEDGKWEVYLTRNEQSFIARAGARLEDGYTVESIEPPTLKLTYLPSGEQQTIAIGETN